MSIVERMKKAAEKVTGIARPGKARLDGCLRERKANAFRFKDDGLVPNHPSWPLIVYRGAVKPPDGLDPAAVFEELFDANGWGDSWRDGIYDYVHYHSRIHEVLGVARGTAKVRFGGDKGRALSLKAGDVAILPAGTGHQRLSASGDFFVVGAYPRSGTYDECTRPEQHAEALRTIPKVGRPAKDPVYGGDGPLLAAWKRER
ncbi:cupin [Mesorhizobium sp. M3A.F.Ca.ET.201.01.1.1]|uniref:cupin n=1 Tax=Mesorhizobium sp. M3A.F.Ca.ET.201.01.1.1 TaxID=2563946 RepID=UPI001093FE55|nr:cupin [Mesorhizobium sp. M3A.F.Ca.ET.201.01.1.1]TGS72202.1 cupin [Mesorhizobium sp. M3A.F.Ca.ET.201.01.1.1]